MKKIYAYDNYEGDKGIIVADSYDKAIALFKEQYPHREVAKTQEQYLECGSYIYELDCLSEENRLYIVCEW